MDNRDAMDLALLLVKQGALRIDPEGRIWRDKIRNRGRLVDTAPRRAENVGGKGYLRLTLSTPEGLVQVMAHRLVWESLRGPIPAGMQINHKDLVRTNNSPSNLEVVDASANIRHSYANGRTAPWSVATEWRPGRARLSPETAEAIRADRAAGESLKTIAARFGISVSHAHRLTASST